MILIERAKNMVLSPKSEWLSLAPEPSSMQGLYTQYIVFLVAIGPIAHFIGITIFGVSIPFMPTYHPSIMSTFFGAIVTFAFNLLGAFIISLIIDALAPTFGGTKNPIQALKVTAYAFTPAWLAGVLYLIPALGVLALIAALYSIYVLYLGLPILMQAPQEKSAGYTALVVVCSILVMLVIGVVAGLAGGGLGQNQDMFAAASNPGTGRNNDQLAQMSAAVNAATARMEAAQKSGNAQDQGAAAASVLAAIATGGAQVEAVDPSVLKGMLPDTIAGLPRTSSESNRTGIAGLQVASADAEYGTSGGGHIKLSITDMGGAKMLGVMAAWAFSEQDKETDTGYEKMGKVEGRPTHELFNKDGPSGQYETMVGGRFMVSADGTNVDMSSIKQAVAAVDLAKLDSLKNQGVQKTN